MANVLCLFHVNYLSPTRKSGVHICNSSIQKDIGANDVFWNSPTPTAYSFKTKASESNRSNTPNSVVCADCDGNGAVLCSQCKGSGLNSVDLFNGQFKAGETCWLCGGKKDILCGNCNGAGFVGGFLSTFDE